MRILLYQDASAESLRLQELADLLGSLDAAVDVAVGQARFELPSEIISNPRSYEQLSDRLMAEARESDLALLITNKPYDNNFFWDILSNDLVILSLFGWEYLTDLDRENGVVYFMASKVLDLLAVGENHDENRGCINDFWWDKTGVDAGMRAAFLCRSCRVSAAALEDQDDFMSRFKFVEELLTLVSVASRAGVNVIERLSDAVAIDDSFDVFLCHNSEDKPAVRTLREQLMNVDLRPWLDEVDLRPGMSWQSALQELVPRIGTAVVCVGENGLGPWQNVEIQVLISEFVRRGAGVIPVMLPTAQTIPELPIFMRQFTWVDLRREVPDPIDHIYFGVTGKRRGRR